MREIDAEIIGQMTLDATTPPSPRHEGALASLDRFSFEHPVSRGDLVELEKIVRRLEWMTELQNVTARASMFRRNRVHLVVDVEGRRYVRTYKIAKPKT